MATTRIFVRGLPPSLTEEDFRTHFAKKYAVTDVRLLPQRRIGYVGFKTAEQAAAAVKYFNKSFMRMSRIAVELADPIPPQRSVNAPTARNHDEATNPLKRKRVTETESVDPKRKDVSKGSDLPRRAEATPTRADDSLQHASTSTNDRRPVPQDKDMAHSPSADQQPPNGLPNDEPVAEAEGGNANGTASDQDWIRSHTSRLLGLVDDDNDEKISEAQDDSAVTRHNARSGPEPEGLTGTGQQPTPPPEVKAHSSSAEWVEAQSDVVAPGPLKLEDVDIDAAVEQVRESGRIFVRNLPYTTNEDELAQAFEPFGTLQEVHVPLDPKSGQSKGLAFVQYARAATAVEAFQNLDGTVFQGRLLHLLPASDKRDNKLDEYAISKLPLKKQKQIQRKSEAGSSTFNWNSMYMNADAVMSSISQRMGVAKSELVDPTSSDAAVKQAQAETHIIQETKSFFEANGVDLEAFKHRERGDTAILVKNFAYGTSANEMQSLFEEYGNVKKVLMPPSGTIAIVEFSQAPQARAAFRSLAYRKFGNSVLFLEKAPKGLFLERPASENTVPNAAKTATAATEVAGYDEPTTDARTTTLFVRNLDFATSNDRFFETFQPLDGLLSAKVKTKPDTKRPGQTLSMGFGFLEFRTSEQAKAALNAMDGSDLDGHRLSIKMSHKGHDAAEGRRREDQEKKKKAKQSKIIIKNLPFEASKKDIQNLFKSYGQLRAVRVPRKFDSSRKGYAFAEFTTAREAESAINALRDTHLLGRRLVLEFAVGEADDPEKEIAKMQQKVGKQSNNVALQKLTAASERRKFVADDQEGEGD